MAIGKMTAILLVLTFLALPVLADTPPLPDKERCPVCGMFVAPYPNWIAVVQFKDDTKAYFDGPKDMFTYLADLNKYNPGAKLADISGVFVTDYYNVELRPVSEVYFVSGSDVLGPMGEEYVALRNSAEVKSFMRDHGGKKVLTYKEHQLIETEVE